MPCHDENCKEADIERDLELPLEVSWNYYQHLVQQQKAVKSSGADADALPKVRTRMAFQHSVKSPSHLQRMADWTFRFTRRL